MANPLAVVIRVVSVIVALALLAAGVLVIVELVAAWAGQGFVVLPADAGDRLRSTNWDDRSVRLALLGLGVTAAVCLLLAALRPPPLAIPTSTPNVWIERRSAERTLIDRLEHVDGVAKARVRVRGDRLLARVETFRRVHPEQVVEAARNELVRFLQIHGLDLVPRVELRTRTK